MEISMIDHKLSLVLMLVILAILGYAVVYLYERYYEVMMMRILLKTGNRRKLPDVKVIFGFYIMIASILFLTILYQTISKPEEKQRTVCNLVNSTIGFNLSDEELNQKLEELQQLEKPGSFSLQEDRINENVSIQYAVKENKTFLYIITYDLDHELQDDEYFYMVNEGVGGLVSYVQKPESSDKKLRFFVEGKIQNEDCDSTLYKFHIRNFTKGKNVHPVNETIEFMVERGGIQSEK